MGAPNERAVGFRNLRCEHHERDCECGSADTPSSSRERGGRTDNACAGERPEQRARRPEAATREAAVAFVGPRRRRIDHRTPWRPGESCRRAARQHKQCGANDMKTFFARSCQPRRQPVQPGDAIALAPRDLQARLCRRPFDEIARSVSAVEDGRRPGHVAKWRAPRFTRTLWARRERSAGDACSEMPTSWGKMLCNASENVIRDVAC